jgi:hypothetical protein
MIFHASIDATDPRRVADFIAELWHGTVMPFPAVIEGSWIVLAGDDRGSAIEVYPRGTELVQAVGDADAYGMKRIATVGTATHLALATPLGQDEVMALAAAAGWTAKYRKRANMFGVIEIWVEDRLMLEALTAEMQAEYTGSLTEALIHHPPLKTAA